jgi:hypothetical protein
MESLETHVEVCMRVIFTRRALQAHNLIQDKGEKEMTQL